MFLVNNYNDDEDDDDDGGGGGDDVYRITDVSGGLQIIKAVSSRALLNCAPVTGDDVERVSTGTKFALREWLDATATPTTA